MRDGRGGHTRWLHAFRATMVPPSWNALAGVGSPPTRVTPSNNSVVTFAKKQLAQRKHTIPPRQDR